MTDQTQPTSPKWKVLTSEDVSPSKWFPIVKETIELPSGKVTEYYRSQLQNVAMIVPITKDNEMIFVKQYKHGIGEVCIEFPAGRIEAGLSAKATAVKELAEETGIVVQESDLQELTELWTEPSKSQVRVSGFLVTGVEVTQALQLEETESIEVLKIPLAELDAFILSGQLHASDTLALLTLVKTTFPELF